MNLFLWTVGHGPGLLELFLRQIWMSVLGWGLLLRGLRFGDRGPLMGRQIH